MTLQGMEGTQTSLLVDIYQYLERNKKLGIEREEVKKQENELELKILTGKEQEDKIEIADVADQPICDENDFNTEMFVKSGETEVLLNCIEDDSVDEGNSRFTVCKVHDQTHDSTTTNSSNKFDIVEENTEENCTVIEETKDTPHEHDSNGFGESTNNEIINETTEHNEELPNAETGTVIIVGRLDIIKGNYWHCIF